MTKWRIDWRGASVTEDDLLVADARLAAELAGSGWRSLDPGEGPEELVAILVAWLVRALGRPVEEVELEISSAPLDELLGALSWLEEGDS